MGVSESPDDWKVLQISWKLIDFVNKTNEQTTDRGVRCHTQGTGKDQT